MKFEDVKSGDYIILPLLQKTTRAHNQELVVLNRTTDTIIGLKFRPSVFEASVHVQLVNYSRREWRGSDKTISWQYHSKWGDIDRKVKMRIIERFFKWPIIWT